MGVIILRKPVVITEPKDNSLQLKVDSLNHILDIQSKQVDFYIDIVDSLKTLPPKIKHIYHDQKAIIPNATLNQLDSIVLSNSGLR